ncbi:MAG: UDP-N-acetylglucosamine 2-epimerase [Roseburia sp.]
MIDEAIRHSITKMSQLHFVSTEVIPQAVMIQMGEQPDAVYNVGGHWESKMLKTSDC